MKHRFALQLSQKVGRYLACICLAALVVGLLVTQYFYGQMMEMRAEIEQLRGVHTQMYDRHVELRTQRAQLSSKNHIVAVASVKLNLYEPQQRQVRRM